MPPLTPVEQRTHDVLIAHQKHDIKNCTCGRWGSDHGQLGQSWAVHVIAELRKAGVALTLDG